jgi:hypothetical protein
MTLLAQQGMSAVWRRSIVEALDVIELLDAHHPDRPRARPVGARRRASCCWTRSRAPGPCSGSRSRPKINQSGDRSRTGARSKAGSRTLRWAVVEAAQHAWRPTNPWHQLYTDVAKRAGKNPAKAAVARKILIAAWHILSRQQAFKPAAPRRSDPASASSRCFLAA